MKPVRVLLIDDESAVRAVLAEYLSGQADIVLCASAQDGLEGLALIDQLLPDVVLLDLIMPRLDGIGVLEALRDRPPEKPPTVVIASQVGDPRVISHCLRLGAHYYLVKPLKLKRLASLLREFCQDTLEAQAQALLQEMGAPEGGLGLIYASLAAAAFAREAGRRLLLKEAYFEAITREHTSYTCVEKNIRTMIAAIHKTSAAAYRDLLGGIPPRPPTNLQFLRLLAAKLLEK